MEIKNLTELQLCISFGPVAPEPKYCQVIKPGDVFVADEGEWQIVIQDYNKKLESKEHHPVSGSTTPEEAKELLDTAIMNQTKRKK